MHGIFELVSYIPKGLYWKWFILQLSYATPIYEVFPHINISLKALRYFAYDWCHSWRLPSKFRRSIFGLKIHGCRMNRFSFSTQEILNFTKYWCRIPRTSQIRKCNILFILKCGVIHRERAGFVWGNNIF